MKAVYGSPEWFEVRRQMVAETVRCVICPLQLNTIEEYQTHQASAIHILRTAKLSGQEVAMCVICRKFAVRPEREHVARPFHQERLTRVSPWWRNHPTVQVVKFEAPEFTERQREQIALTVHSAAYIAYMTEHVRLHLPLFRHYQNMRNLIDGLESSPEYSSDEPTDVVQFRTP